MKVPRQSLSGSFENFLITGGRYVYPALAKACSCAGLLPGGDESCEAFTTELTIPLGCAVAGKVGSGSCLQREW